MKDEASELSWYCYIAGGQSYVLALCYSEQLSAATHSMLQLSALALDWGANLVETTVFQSFLFGIEGIYPHHHLSATSNASSLRLFEIYNSTLLNDYIHKRLSPDVSMDSFDVFLSKAEREVTLIHFATEHSTTPHVRRISPDSSLDLLAAKLAFHRHVYIANCSISKLNSFTDLVKKVERSLNNKVASLQQTNDKSASQMTLLSEPFKITRVLCLSPKYSYMSDTLSKYVSLPGTVVFTNWLGCCLNECTIHNVKGASHTLGDNKDIDSLISEWPLSSCNTNFRFSVPTRMFYMGKVRDAQLFHHSRIMYAAKRQLDYMRIDQRKGFVSVHIRIERIIRDAAKSNYKLLPRKKLEFMENCVKRILDRLKELQRLLVVLNRNAENHTLKYLLITDISDHGTNSLTTSTLHNDAQLFLEILKSHGMQIHHCNLGLLSGQDAHNSGYVSLVEMTMLALGQKLLLVGGGGFQVNIAHKFYSLHGRKRDVFRETCDF